MSERNDRGVPAPISDAVLGLEQFLENDYARVVVALAAIGRDRVAAEDAVAEAVANGMKALRDGKRIEAWDRWVFVVARNHERNRLRRAWREFGRGPAASIDNTEALAEHHSLRAALRQLPQRQREVTVMHYYLDLSVAEIAGSVGISDGAVKNALYNARLSLHRELEIDGQEVLDDQR